MKKLVVSLILLFGLFICPLSAYAAGGVSISTGSLNITEGSSASFSITASNAAGNIVVSSSNPSVATVSVGSVWIENQTITVSVTAKSVGSTSIVVTLADVATFDEEVLTGTRIVNVNVQAKPTPNNGGGNGGGNNYVPTPTPKPNQNPAVTDNRSNNTNLIGLKVNGNNVSLKDGIYALEVSNFVSNINIEATAEDNKATVNGNGKKDISVGENVFDIVVTAENGTSTTYKLIVTRKEYNSLKDLDEVLKQKKDIEIRVFENDKLSKGDLEKIIDSKKMVSLKFMSSDKVLYTWILDGKKIKRVNSFNPIISTKIDNNDEMEEALNYPDGIYLNFIDCKDIPKGAILKYFVGDKYSDKDKINLYIYDEKAKKVIELEKDIVVKDGYVELKISDTVKHVMTQANVLAEQSSGFNVWIIISIVLFIIVIVSFVLFMITTMKKKDKTTNSISVGTVDNNVSTFTNETKVEESSNNNIEETI